MEGTARTPGERDFESERSERDSFVVLQHVYSLSGGNIETMIAPDQLTVSLGFRIAETLHLVDHLIEAGLLARGPRGSISITASGSDYVRRLAWRRRSVRLPGSSDRPRG
jgi:hypothetical protein